MSLLWLKYLAGLFGLLFFLSIPKVIYASDYYIDPNGNNGNTGSSSTSAWRDFTNVNSRTLAPGDKVFLKRGGVWNQQLTIKGSGNSSNFIEIGAYGAGPRPHIRRGGDIAERAMIIHNPSYLKVFSLEVSNAGAGIVVYYKDVRNQNSLYFDDILAHDFKGIFRWSGSQSSNPNWKSYTSPDARSSYGIGITGSNIQDARNYNIISDLKITNTEVYKTGVALAIDRFGDNSGVGWEMYRNVLFDNVNLHDNDLRDEVSYATLYIVGCSDCVFSNILIDKGVYWGPNGTSAIFMGEVNKNSSDYLTFDNLTLINTPESSAPDNVGIDFECCGKRTIIKNSHFENNAGPSLSFLANGPEYATDIDFYDSVFINSGFARKFDNQGQINVNNWPRENKPTGKIHDNWYINPSGISFVGGNGDLSGLQVYNNQQGNPPKKPSITINSPRKDDYIIGNSININYTLSNITTEVSTVKFLVDGNQSYTDSNRDGNYTISSVSEGFHSIKAYLGNSGGEQVGKPYYVGINTTLNGGAFCGNGNVESSEQCDDGNIGNNDGCNSACEFEDGHITSTPTNPPAPVPGDGNNDGVVDGKDFIIWLTHYSQNVSGTNNGDYNDSGKVEIGDYLIWISNFSF